jgi:abhydrolase domain-containing protein 8
VMGHSYGGALAAYLASRNPERVNKLILLAASRCQPGTGLPFIYQLPLFILNYIRPILKKRFREAAFAPMTPLELIAEENLGGSNNQLYVIKALLKATPNIPLLNVSQLNVPTLIIAGKYDKIISNVKMIAFYDNLPKRTISIIEEGAHMLMLEKPQQVNELILEFIKS